MCQRYSYDGIQSISSKRPLSHPCGEFWSWDRVHHRNCYYQSMQLWRAHTMLALPSLFSHCWWLLCYCMLFQLCPTLCNPMTAPTRPLCSCNFPGKNTAVGCHFLLQGFFLTKGFNLPLPASPPLAGRFFFFLNHWATWEAQVIADGCWHLLPTMVRTSIHQKRHNFLWLVVSRRVCFSLL